MTFLAAMSTDEYDDYDTGYAVPGRPLGTMADFCSRDGAETLKRTIEAYWRERGLDVMISLHNVGFHPAIRAARYDVRSDMVNGMPRKSKHPTPANDQARGPQLVEDVADLEFED